MKIFDEILWQKCNRAVPLFLFPVFPNPEVQRRRAKMMMMIDDGDDDDGDDDDGYPAYSHHDKIPPWWEYVTNDKGGNVSVTKSHHT